MSPHVSTQSALHARSIELSDHPTPDGVAPALKEAEMAFPERVSSAEDDLPRAALPGSDSDGQSPSQSPSRSAPTPTSRIAPPVAEIAVSASPAYSNALVLASEGASPVRSERSVGPQAQGLLRLRATGDRAGASLSAESRANGESSSAEQPSPPRGSLTALRSNSHPNIQPGSQMCTRNDLMQKPAENSGDPQTGRYSGCSNTSAGSLGRIGIVRRSSLSFFCNWANSIRGSSQSNPPQAAGTPGTGPSPDAFISNSPTIANLSSMAGPTTSSNLHGDHSEETQEPESADAATVAAADVTRVDVQPQRESSTLTVHGEELFSVRLTPIIDHSSSNSGLYFAPIIRRMKPNEKIPIGRYTEKNKSAAHALQGSSQPIVFKSKVVSRTHALLQSKPDGLWYLKDSKSSSGTFLNNVRLSQATMELDFWPVVDGDTIQLGLDYRGGSEDIYRCVKMRCEFNHSWQRKVNQYNLDIHERMKNLRLDTAEGKRQASECAICLLTLDPCQALFISPCSHSWHYKCIRPVIIKSYPQFYCPNCRSMCDLETDIEDEI